MALFTPTYFSPISQYREMMKFDSISFEIEDNFQKQTYRNRCFIYGANGKQLLNIPISHSSTTRKKKSKDIIIKDPNWQNKHYKSIESAYNHSPFFEFYKDDLKIVLNKKYKYLLDINIDTFLFINNALELNKKHTFSKNYIKSPSNDYRHLANSKNKLNLNLKKYTQVFDTKFGFIEDLSILDLLFMEGPNAISYL
tara:strand:+ start:24506 stop:25096 length:591 start_codon:yes stop_codon:yes gene_type:complete